MHAIKGVYSIYTKYVSVVRRQSGLFKQLLCSWRFLLSTVESSTCHKLGTAGAQQVSAVREACQVHLWI
jgi:hypothetical protein